MRTALLLLCGCLLSMAIASTGPRIIQLLAPSTLSGSAGDIALSEDAIAALAEIRGPVRVVTSLGQSKLGKSFFLNQVLNASADARFPVNSTWQPGSSGISFLYPLPCIRGGRLVDAAACTPNDERLLLLDVEGSGTTYRASSFDHALYSLAALASDALILHTSELHGVLPMRQLQTAADLATALSARAGGEQVPGLPALLWAYQRTSLIVQDPILAHAAAVAAHPGDPDAEALRQALGRFPVQSVIALPSAVHDSRLFAALPDLDRSALDPKYVSQVRRATEWILQPFNQMPVDGALATDPATPRRQSRTGPAIVAFLDSLCAVLREAPLPSQLDTLAALSAASRAAAAAELSDALDAVPLPRPAKVVAAAADAAVVAAVANFKRSAGLAATQADVDTFQIAAERLAASLPARNAAASAAACDEQIRLAEDWLALLRRDELPQLQRVYGDASSLRASFSALCVGPGFARALPVFSELLDTAIDLAASTASARASEWYQALALGLFLVAALSASARRLLRAADMAQSAASRALAAPVAACTIALIPTVAAIASFSLGWDHLARTAVWMHVQLTSVSLYRTSVYATSGAVVCVLVVVGAGLPRLQASSPHRVHSEDADAVAKTLPAPAPANHPASSLHLAPRPSHAAMTIPAFTPPATPALRSLSPAPSGDEPMDGAGPHARHIPVLHQPIWRSQSPFDVGATQWGQK
jgi:hypothetical protein